MRKIMTFIIAGVLILSMVGCGGSNSIPKEGIELSEGLYYAGDDIPVGKYKAVFEKKESSSASASTTLYEDSEHYKSHDDIDHHWLVKEGESAYLNLKEKYILKVDGQLKLYPQQ